MDLLEELRWRGMLQDATEGAADTLASGPQTVYIGFDPTASSLHVGSLLTIMGLVHAQRAGHSPIALVGGGTGLIGDPSGKSQERQLLSRAQVEENVEGIHAQLERFLDFDARANPARMANNLDWLGSLPLLDFLRDTGKHFSINALLNKESIRRRVQSDEVGLSYTEFSYVLLQAYDFLALHERYGCTGQMGGSDQWGNITAGTDLIRRVKGARAWGVVWPLMTTASGVKFGKTEAGTVWLDPERTSPFRFYQFWLNTDDADAVRWLKAFTLFDRSRVEELEGALAADPAGRAAQRALAEDVTRRVHGEDGLARARKATDVLFGGTLEGLGAAEIADIFADVPAADVPRAHLSGEGRPILDLLAETGVTPSKGEARRAVEGGGIYVNGVRVDGIERSVTLDDAIEGRFLVLRRGKKNHHLVRVVG
ncbi:MAG: tyrosine--tRNA ligase [Gemmatimonadota bacterium]